MQERKSPNKVIMIDPCNMDSTQANMLTDWLLKNPLGSLMSEETYIHDSVSFKISNEDIKKIDPLPSKNPEKSREIHRYAVKGTPFEGSKVYPVLGKLVYDENKKFFTYHPITHDEKKLVAKEDIYEYIQREYDLTIHHQTLKPRKPIEPGTNHKVASNLFITHLSGENLADFMDKMEEEPRQYLSLDQLCTLYVAICEAVKRDVHDRPTPIVHKDLKLTNTFMKWENLEGQPAISIIDFGLSKFAHENDSDWEPCGTPDCVSPEVQKRQGSTISSDLFSMGIMFAHLSWLLNPFHDWDAIKSMEEMQILDQANEESEMDVSTNDARLMELQAYKISEDTILKAMEKMQIPNQEDDDHEEEVVNKDSDFKMSMLSGLFIPRKERSMQENAIKIIRVNSVEPSTNLPARHADFILSLQSEDPKARPTLETVSIFFQPGSQHSVATHSSTIKKIKK